MIVLQHIRDKSFNAGKYVARNGRFHAYTRKLEDAQTYKSRQHAQDAACVDSEIVVELEMA